MTLLLSATVVWRLYCISICISDDNDQKSSEDFEVIFPLENIPALHLVATVIIIDDEEKGIIKKLARLVP